MEQAETKTTTCYMCACRCGIRVHLRNGEVRYIDGNPEHPLNKGVICAKGASGIMKQYSPARLTRPLMRKAGAERGAAEFEPVSWERALSVIEERLARIRATDPRQFALFTGRDQMQALTGLFARQFGTPNYAAHGGFCSVNMAAGMIYSIGGSFWEFGGPDLDRARLFVMVGTAEDHHSNPLKIAISKFKRSGGRFISINPVRTGYSAIADEWIPIRPGTDGALLLALNHEIVRTGLYDEAFLARYTNSGYLVNLAKVSAEYGLFACDSSRPENNPYRRHSQLWWDRHTDRPVVNHTEGADPCLKGEFSLDNGTPVKPAFQLLVERLAEYTPEWAAGITGIPAQTIRRLAREMGVTARDHRFELPIPWTDSWGVRHETVTGVPVAFHAMRGLAAHSNGFHTIRSLSILMSLLGTIDRPGGFRHKAPYPRGTPPIYARNPTSLEAIHPGMPLGGAPLGFPAGPDDLFVDDEGRPVRIDKAFSWEYPLAIHGMMHNVIANAWRGDPYRIDTLMIFMANMAWNSSMNPVETRRMLNDRDEKGEFKIPFVIVCDAFQSEMTAFADLILPDTTYLERHDVMSLLDRPISEFDGPIDSVRVPVVPPKGECRPFQDVLIELAGRLKFPAFVNTDENGNVRRKFRDYADFIVNFETEPGSGQGFLIGWRGKDGEKAIVGEPNPRQWEMYAKNNCVYHYRMPENCQYMRNWNQDYHEWAQRMKLRRQADPIMIQIYAEVLQRFRLAALDKWPSRRRPPAHLKERIATYFDPLPFHYAPLEVQATDTERYPLAAITQRPMAMYHSWDSQNAWLRQIHAHNYLYINPLAARAQDIADGDWIWIESMHGRVRCMCRYSEAVEPGTVWTWNAIGKARGAWGLAGDANEAREGFLLNHLISDHISSPLKKGRVGEGILEGISNSDPVTGQAGWYDVRVRISKAEATEPKESWPQFGAAAPLPGAPVERPSWLAYIAGGGGSRDENRVSSVEWQGSSGEWRVASGRARRVWHTSRAQASTRHPSPVTRHSFVMKQLALVIDLNVCVGCHACVTSCKEWNTSGAAGSLSDENPYGRDPTGTFFNRVQTFEVGEFPATQTVHFPKSCLHCEDPPCVPVCPTGASYKRAEDGIVLVDYDKCIGCKYCAWACPYGVRELDERQKVMKKCTLCVDRIYDPGLPEADRKPACVQACPTNARLFGDIHDPQSEVSQAIRERDGYTLMPEWGTRPANHYLPRRVTPAAPDGQDDDAPRR